MHSKHLRSNQESKIENCFITVCICPFYGVIISGSLEGDIAFEDCSFSECSALHGGAIAVSNRAKLAVEKCVFSECIDTFPTAYGYGGAVFSNGSNCEITNSSFSKCAGTGSGPIGGAFAHISNNFSIVIDSTFENCSASYGGSVAWYTGGSGSIYNTVFKCSRATLSTIEDHIIHCFSHSMAPRKVVLCAEYAEPCNDKGVAYNSWLPDPQPEIHISNSGSDVNTCGGAGSECQTVEYGVTRWNSYLKQNVLMSSEEFEEDIIEIDWKNIVLNGIENGKSTIKCHEASLTDHLISIGNGSLNAKRISFACAFNRSAVAVMSSGSVQLELCSFTKSAQSNQPSTQPLINVENGYVTIMSVNVSQFVFSQGCAFATSNCKSITISNTSFSDIECTQNGGCLSASWSERSDGTFSTSINNCIFKRCRVVADGNGGGALFLSLQNTCSATISSCSFEECEAPFDSQVGYGGGIFLDLGHSDAAFAITSPSFSVEKPNKAKHGNDLFVQSPNLRESITNETLPFAYALGHSSFDSLQGFTGNDHEHSIPLVLLLEDVGQTIHVRSNDGVDVVVCGFSDYPCHSLNYCVERLEEENAKTVAVLASATIENETTLHNLDLKSSNTSKAEITCIKLLQASTRKAMAATGDVSVELIHFLLPSSFDTEIEALIFLSSGGMLTMKSCSFEMQQGELGQMGYWLFQICGGILNIDSCTLSSDCLQRAPIAVCESDTSTQATIISLNVKNTDIGNHPLIHVIPSTAVKLLNGATTSNGIISLDSCSFEGIVHAHANSAVLFSSHISSCVECSHWNVTNVKSTQSIEGGAMKVVTDADGQFKMENATFTKCCVECETAGKGGGIYFDCSASNAFSFQQMTFDQCSAKHGKNMFFLSSDLNVSITNQSLALEVSETASDTNLFIGSDSTKANFDLCRFLIGFASQEIHLSKNSGWDVLRCGSESEPCATMQYGQKHFCASDNPAQANMSIFLVIDEVQVDCEVDISNNTLTSSDIDSHSALLFAAAISPQPGKQQHTDSVLVNTGTCSLLSVDVCCDHGSGWSQTYLISTAAGAFSAQSCLFTSTSGTAIPYCVVACFSGTCELSLCSFQSIKCEGHIFIASCGSSSILSNVSMSNVELMGKSIAEVLPQVMPPAMTQEINEDICPTVQLKCCTLHSLLQSTPSEPSIISSSGSQPFSVSVQNTSIKNCGSSQSESGGCITMRLNEEAFFHCTLSTISECFCSATGRGGAIFLDCSSIAGDSALPFLFKNITFLENKAFRGRDIYVRCSNVESQIRNELFQLDFRPPYNQELAIWGCTAQNYADEQDLLLLVIVYQSETIFASSSADNTSDSRQCGAINAPCSSLNIALSHIIPSVYSNLLVDEVSLVSGEISIHDVSIKSLEQERDRGTILLNRSIESRMNSLLTCASRVKIEFLKFMFVSAFSSPHPSLLSLTDGSLSIADALFSQDDSNDFSEMRLNCSIILVENGRLLINECTFASLRLGSPCVAAKGGQYCSFMNLNISDVNSDVLFDFRNLANLSMQQELISSCALEQSALILHNCKDSQLQKIQVRNVESNSSLIVFSSDGSGACSNIQCYHSEFDAISVLSGSLLSIECQDANVEMNNLSSTKIVLTNGCAVNLASANSSLSIRQSSFQNISRDSMGPCCLAASLSSPSLELENCSFRKCVSPSDKGSISALSGLSNASITSCAFDGETGPQQLRSNADSFKDLCKWNGSMIDLLNCSGATKDTTIANSSKGGLSISGGNISIQFGMFSGNNPNAAGYPSIRNNVICSHNALLNIVSLKGGDGFLPNTSMWVAGDDCTLAGLASERLSPFFIPQLHSVNSHIQGDALSLDLIGSLLLPCHLLLQIDFIEGSLHQLKTYPLQAELFENETEIHAVIPASIVTSVPDTTEVSVCILFGNAETPSSTKEFILKNMSEIAQKEDERITKSGKEGKTFWPIIVIALVVILLIIMAGFIVFVVRWRKQKRRTEELEIIVNDTLKKDPKLIEMTTMEMSPEEQWRRAEREAEKKNEERIKKRVYAKSLQHSESSEHLLSESGSTEYILGKDSDKIPDWALEKLEEDEDDISKKRTPSPSISSTSTTSTTDTSDTESTFVRREDLCPTTSSMSNLVDAMACSSPHEKLIVDLRDSLFMLLHGRNEKKEMAIGSLQEREMTAAQILFWVANLALHSFEDDGDELSSLANLSPHIVLFSEHMVICIAMHSDCSSSDSDTSSISSSTVVTSTSDCSTVNRNGKDSPPPSSAFEDEDDNRKECLRWKAPELLINKKMGATKESVVFSIGMMLWECLTLEIPFGEYEAEVAGQKIVNGERPNIDRICSSSFASVAKECWSRAPGDRPSLESLKRIFIQHFPAGAVMLTMSDAVDFEPDTDYGYRGSFLPRSATASSNATATVTVTHTNAQHNC
ncbi:putative Protein tyrosine and serine/threonine kinase [Monocercomonoides exilis]|uniref:putative Protein tyrosine and serine/threonine kinase n=1 Tax=Monocercomonoides exilis TaxID=2049356 RepID=UPI00355AB6ED|nr:putative Protein tyrosine and serine/threonine kinase [Monocercomonoides exilis]|eukprot:MONOS_9692.1-p1 / transcript=MONOS_9692.1 / gene=MONOS_9692 / organism=Monocercomonoides_exilis_PA203 / gene_product=unspecified product / transcript_product=unspecified product / location=Mono_scaffold00410:5335-12897(-) / protein_length=2414 / sequence_SO=supercontig / SO=protein_coding / is_pseudo=false